MSELTNQTGHAHSQWPLVVAKELIDNALDACEEAEVAPVIAVTLDANVIVVEDNAGGLDGSTIESVLDYTVRVSSREAYTSPTRGAQGNALKTILAMGYVLDRSIAGGDAVGVTLIESRGLTHRIEFRVDHIDNQPKIIHRTAPSPVLNGTKVTVLWPKAEAKRIFPYAAKSFIELVSAYRWFNPHLSLRGILRVDAAATTWGFAPAVSGEFIAVEATNPHWEKWRPSNPTSAHWYDAARLERYLAAHVARDRDLKQNRTVRAFVAEFRGFSSTAAQSKVLDEVGCSYRSLASFFGVKRVNHDGLARLLTAMKAHSRPVAPKLLGIIGGDHLKQCFLAAGGHAETFKYQMRQGVTDGLPYVAEFAFGLQQAGLAGNGLSRIFVTGANWSAAIVNPFRAFGSTGEGLENTLAQVRANANQPVICALHLASARIQFADRGKSSIILTDDAKQPE